MSEVTERSLCAGYTAMADHFALALELLHQLHHAIQENADSAPVLEQLTATFGHIATIEGSLTEHRNTWTATGKKTSQELNRTLERLEELVTRAQSRVRAAEVAFLSKMEVLAHSLEGAHRSQQMHTAYSLALAESAPANQASLEC